ncbi:serine/threonine protein kinase [Polyangium sorediatum]|uniref:Serine/threonine-protein kinase n=1 Tax=Polyangium sorediatum TaxID=889274 RepID=A0ABT6NS02_9BACT|nr:serine/threonine-protein kinase [Polyangium sorediatum]MDI1431107.1 serine/threonine-protein kinase [Polyangium sorediatum]
MRDQQAPGTGEPARYEPKVGDSIDERYQLVQEIAYGHSYSRIFSARAAPLILKFPQPGQDQRFKREVAIHLDLRHENIVRVYGHGTHEGRPFMALEHAGAVNLHQVLAKYIEQRRLPPIQDVQHVFRALASALAYIRAEQVVHRDIKPANVCLMARGDEPAVRIKLIDFGIAKHAKSPAITGEDRLLGTEPYMCPEMSPKHPERKAVHYHADLWSVAVVLHELLAGKQLFPHGVPDRYAGYGSIAKGGSPSPGLEFFKDFFDRALHRDIEKRFETIEEMCETAAACFERALSTTDPSAPSLASIVRDLQGNLLEPVKLAVVVPRRQSSVTSELLKHREQRGRSRMRWLLPVGAVVTVVAVGVAFWAGQQQGRPTPTSKEVTAESAQSVPSGAPEPSAVVSATASANPSARASVAPPPSVSVVPSTIMPPRTSTLKAKVLTSSAIDNPSGLCKKERLDVDAGVYRCIKR